MAKGFPYFKFVVTEWLTGDIVFEDFAVQGLFINICAIYWQRGGKLTVDDVNRRYKTPKELPELIDRFLTVTDGFISIKFLDEQMDDASYISSVNTENGQKGGRPKKTEPKPEITDRLPNESDENLLRSKEDKEVNKNKKEIQEQQDVFSLFSFPVELKPQWDSWIEYKKKQHKFSYKDVKYEASAFRDLMKLAKNDIGIATQIINKSIGSGWKGFFELKGAFMNGNQISSVKDKNGMVV